MHRGLGACRSWDLSFLNKGDIRPRLACESYYQHLPLEHTFRPHLVFHRCGLTLILSLTTTPTCAVFASSTARERTASDATVPASVTAFFVTSARTSRSAERTCSSCANIDLTAFSSWAFAALGLPGPIGEDAALASGS